MDESSRLGLGRAERGGAERDGLAHQTICDDMSTPLVGMFAHALCKVPKAKGMGIIRLTEESEWESK